MQADELNFKGGNPGAVKYGNFINYYQFHPPENRLKLLPTDIWGQSNPNGRFHCLDLGCNSGDLTISIHEFLKARMNCCDILGVDIDPMLIQRAQEKGTHEDIEFVCLDIMTESSRDFIKDYLKKRKIIKFDAIFCFSLTMWIHLNHGDDGLKDFLQKIVNLGKLLVIEPQPWKCYRTAVKRMKLTDTTFPLFRELKMRQTIENDIHQYLVETCKTLKIYESEHTTWGRKILVYKL